MKRLRKSSCSSSCASRRPYLPSRVALLFLSGFLALLWLGVSGDLWAQGKPGPSPAVPVDPKLLLTNAQRFLAQEAKIRPGESVLLISDRSVDEMVREAFVQAARNAGGEVHEIVLQGDPALTDGFEIARQMRFRIWYPEWIWKAAADVDVLLEMTNLAGSHQRMARPSLPARTRSVDVPFSRREQLADPRARGNYPEEILTTIAKVLWRQMWGAQQIELKDGEGTDLRWSLDSAAWEEMKDYDPTRNSTHITQPPPFRAHSPNMQGWLAGSATHSGPLPPLRLRVQDGRVVEVQGGAHVGEYLRKMFVEYKAIQYPGFPGPGSNWVEEAAVGTHPGHSRVPGAETFGWSAEMSSWVGAARAGVFHFAVGTSHSGRNYPFARQHNLEIQHWDMEQYTPTLVMDERTIIRQGHLLALDDPEVRRVASRYGDPDELLRVTWSPNGK